MNRPLRLSLTVFALLPTLAFAQSPEGGGDGAKKKERDPQNVSAQDGGEAALKKFSVAEGLQVDLWAEEPLLANPVAFDFDGKGRAFVAETYRRRTSVPDIRKNMEWLLDSLAMRTVEDRVAFLKKTLAPELNLRPTKNHEDLNNDAHFDWRDWAVESEQVKLVTDSDGDGKADTSSVFAEGFNSVETGVGAGVAVHGNDVYYACSPDLWRLHGASGTQTEQKEKLLTGLGVHIAYGGHDTHGPKFGPDGRLYWTIADCGARITTKEGKIIDNPDSGAVFRCEADGSNAELFATGLRNPQSLTFNDLGDLFTGDNNADGGDKARWTHLVEGGDYGWRIGWQFLPKLGPWNSDGLWQLTNSKSNIALLPPVGLIGHGPAGIAHYPGTGLPDSYADHFFYADFPGGVRSFAIQPKGASYTVENPNDVLQDNTPKNMTGKLLWGLYPSDVAFGVDGGVYVLDWVFGWDKTGKGRIFRVHNPEVDASAPVQETKKLLAEDFSKRSTSGLAKLLGYIDQRVRLAAQFELARRGDGSTLAEATSDDNPRLARLHAIWGLSQIGRRSLNAVPELKGLAHDKDPEVRAQWAKMSGEIKQTAHVDLIIRLLADDEPRVRFFAAQALGKLGFKEAVPALIAMRNLNDDSDPYVRHAAALSLAALADEPSLIAAAGNESKAVRNVAFLALRRQRSNEVGRFLTDKNPQLVLDAARSIHDLPIAPLWPQLAALAEKPNLPEPLSRRAVNANYLMGDLASARRLGKIGGDVKMPAALRLDALQALTAWSAPFRRDRVTGLWRNMVPTRDDKAAVDAATRIIPALLREPSEPLRVAAAELAGALKITSVEGVLASAVGDDSLGGATRAAALRALDQTGSTRINGAFQIALNSPDKVLAETVRELAVKISPKDAVKLNAAVLGTGKVHEQQEALATLATIPGPEADAVLLAQYDLYASNKLPAALWLDILEAAGQRDNPILKQKLADREAKLAANADAVAKWRECLEGGNAKLGRETFTENADAACMRCHKWKGEGGDVGPDLAKIAQVSDRVYLLESIIDPNAKIAPGYNNVLLTLQNGDAVVGILNSEDNGVLTVTSIVDGKKVTVKAEDVKERTQVPSPMPPGLGDVLGKRALRNVIEFLATGK